jgi:hypothetical protein
MSPVILHAGGGRYLVNVKGYQPGLKAQLRTLPSKDVPPGHGEHNRAHGHTAGS